MGLDLSTDEAIYRGIQWHVGHNIVCVQYANYENVAIECEDCGLVLLSADVPEEESDTDTILVKFLGGQETMDFDNFARTIVQDHQHAAHVIEWAREQDGFWDDPDTRMEYEIINDDLLTEQMQDLTD